VYEYWAWSKGLYAGPDKSFFQLPKPGEGVWVEFENGDRRYPVWSHGWFGESELPAAARQDYGDNQVWQSGRNRIELNEAKGLFRVTTQSGTVLEVNRQGIHLGSDTAAQYRGVLGEKLVALLRRLLQTLSTTTTTPGIGPLALATGPQFGQMIADLNELLSETVTLD
jgi:uncharacterized protein involved in type VI secretion and phage assembly